MRLEFWRGICQEIVSYRYKLHKRYGFVIFGTSNSPISIHFNVRGWCRNSHTEARLRGIEFSSIGRQIVYTLESSAFLLNISFCSVYNRSHIERTQRLTKEVGERNLKYF